MVLNILKLKTYIDESGMKQKYISDKIGISEPTLSLILNGRRKCEVGEYASICSVLGVGLERFIEPEREVV